MEESWRSRFFKPGQQVRVVDGTFNGMQATILELLPRWQLVRVELDIFGRPVPVELEYWQVEVV